MCQGSCSTNTCQQTCSPVEAKLRQALAEIQKTALQQLQLRGKDGQPHPGAFTMQLIATLAEEGLAPAAAAEQPVTVHRARVDLFATCGCRSTADCRCMAMDTQAKVLYQAHERNRRAA
jgi:hypothetical protein